jgi:hypothetical protein
MPGQSMSDLWWTKLHRGRFLYEYFTSSTQRIKSKEKEST